MIELMSPQVFHILLALATGPRHGYGMLKDISEHTGGRLRLGTGTIYSAIQRLLEVEWIEETDERAAAAEDDERRQYYRLTDKGREALRIEARQMHDAVSVARERRVLGTRAASIKR